MDICLCAACALFKFKFNSIRISNPKLTHFFTLTILKKKNKKQIINLIFSHLLTPFDTLLISIFFFLLFSLCHLQITYLNQNAYFCLYLSVSVSASLWNRNTSFGFWFSLATILYNDVCAILLFNVHR